MSNLDSKPDQNFMIRTTDKFSSVTLYLNRHQCNILQKAAVELHSKKDSKVQLQEYYSISH